jgi:hypothetical protein
MITVPFESIPMTFAKPAVFEKIKTFVPRVPGPTSRPFVAKRFVTVTEFETTRFAKFEIVATFRVPRFEFAPKIEVAFRVRILAVTRLPNAMLAVERFADVAFSVRILAVTRLPKAMLAVERFADVAFSVRILAVTRLAEAVFNVTMFADEEAFMVVA